MLTINNETLQLANMTEQQLLQEIAIMLYQKGKLTFGQATQFAQINYAQFQMLLGTNQIPVNYGTTELLEDVETIKRLKNR